LLDRIGWNRTRLQLRHRVSDARLLLFPAY
jgi:hypothetical protein